MADKINILVVDDDPYLLDLLIETLTTIGYDAHGVTDAAGALEYLKTNSVRLVITDVKMPGMNGIELARAIKEEYADLPVIFITGVFSSSILQKVEADGFLAKPFRISQIEEMIETIINTPRPGEAPPADRILVVDDDDSFRVMLIETLKVSGYTAIGAESGKEAIDLLNEGNIAAVITDVKMPGMSGISLARQVRNNWPQVPVILVTAYMHLDDEPVSPALVSDGILMKPFKIESITDLLESIKSGKSSPAS